MEREEIVKTLYNLVSSLNLIPQEVEKAKGLEKSLCMLLRIINCECFLGMFAVLMQTILVLYSNKKRLTSFASVCCRAYRNTENMQIVSKKKS